jgi:AcrR family transcriptional regulator
MTDQSAAIERPGVAARRALTTAAIAVIADHGLEGVTVRTVAARAAVSKSLAGHHFQSKDKLLAAVAGELMTVTPAPPLGKEETELERLVRFCRALLTQSAADPVRGRALLVLLGATHREAAQRGAIGDWQRALLTQFHGLLTAGRARGTIRADLNPKTQAVLVLGGVYGVLWLVLTRGGKAATFGDGLSQWVIDALSPRPDAPASG